MFTPRIATRPTPMRPKNRLVILCLLFCSNATPIPAAEEPPPNIIVIFTDDHGWTDLGSQGIDGDILTPHLDALAANGLRATNGYVTAPQCVPSRGGLLSGQYQNRFGLESNPEGSDRGVMERFAALETLPERLKSAGYVTGMAGKWHLGPEHEIASHGFDKVFHKNNGSPGFWNMDLEGKDLGPEAQQGAGYHLDLVADFASAFVRRYHDKPFFFYAAFRGPHTPLDAPEKYTSRFPGEMPERRRQALAMISAIYDGVGRIVEALRETGTEERTLIFFMGDNGAPLKIHRIDSPLDGDAGGWDGSLNDPLNGEKGMLSEGGIRVPWLAYWKGTIPGGQTYDHPVISLDVAATAAALAGIETRPGEIDGVNLIPFFKGEVKTPPHDALYWRWIAQSAVREGNWKLLRGGESEYLYDLSVDPEEKSNLASQHPEIATRLRARLESWSNELSPPGMSTGPMAATWVDYFSHYLDGRKIPLPATGVKAKGGSGETPGWQVRNGTLAEKEGMLELTPGSGKNTFITRSGLKVTAPAMVRLELKTSAPGEASVSWRLDGDKDFLPARRASFPVAASDDWQMCEVAIPDSGKVIHLRIHFPDGVAYLRGIDLKAVKP